jgi:accessory gene regulator B
VRNSQETICEDEIRYGIEVLLGSILQAVLLLAIAFWLNLFYEAVGILMASALYRRYSGGAHCTAYYRCTLTSLITFLPLAYLAQFLLPYNNLLTVCSAGLIVLTIAWLKVPVDNPTNPITDPIRRQELRRKSLIMAVFLIILTITLLFVYPLGGVAIMMGLLWQSITLTIPGHIYISAWDTIFLHIEKIVRKGDYYAEQS